MATTRKVKRMTARRVVGKAKTKSSARPARRPKPSLRKHVARKAVAKAGRRAVVGKKAVVKVERRKVSSARLVKLRHARTLESTHVRNLLTEIAGERALKVVGEMTEPMSDEDIAKRAGTKISEIRAVLNKLHAAGVAVYDRTRNDEGWYTYTWRLTMDNAQKMLDDRKSADQRSTRDRTVLEGAADHYVCPTCSTKTGTRLNFEQAVETSFRCPDCTEMLKYVERKR